MEKPIFLRGAKLAQLKLHNNVLYVVIGPSFFVDSREFSPLAENIKDSLVDGVTVTIASSAEVNRFIYNYKIDRPEVRVKIVSIQNLQMVEEIYNLFNAVGNNS